MVAFLIVLGVIILIILAVAIRNVVIVRQSEAYVIERFGAYAKTWEMGMHIKVPFIERVAKTVSLKEQVLDFPPQPVITSDNVTIQIDAVVYCQITDPELYTYGVERPLSAIENLTATTLRNIIGEMDLDSTLTSRDTINGKMRSVLDEATDPWGIRINRVELKNIQPPSGIQEAMERQMKAERERREAILQAEGQKQSQILVAEGQKEAITLQAEADRDAMIMRAEGEAEAILKVQDAEAQALRKLTASNPSDQVLTLRSLDAFAKAADGQATKIIIPSEIQGIAGLASGVVETVKSDSPVPSSSTTTQKPTGQRQSNRINVGRNNNTRSNVDHVETLIETEADRANNRNE